MAAEKLSEIKKKKKKWLAVLGGKEFNYQNIAEIYIDEPENAVGRKISTNLMTILRDPKKQLFNVEFKITEIKDNSAVAELIRYSIQIAQLKRITKKGKNKVDDSFVYETKDNKKVVIKPILLTKTLVYKSILKELRKTTRHFLAEFAKKNTLSQVMKDVISGNLQKDIKENAKKVYPLTNVIIKDAHIGD